MVINFCFPRNTLLSLDSAFRRNHVQRIAWWVQLYDYFFSCLYHIFLCCWINLSFHCRQFINFFPYDRISRPTKGRFKISFRQGLFLPDVNNSNDNIIGMVGKLFSNWLSIQNWWLILGARTCQTYGWHKKNLKIVTWNWTDLCHFNSLNSKAIFLCLLRDQYSPQSATLDP